MANQGITMKLHGGLELDKKLASIQNSVGTRIVKSSLSKSATQVKKTIKNTAPQATKDTTGFKTSSRNVTKGQLKRSVQAGLLNKVNVGRNTFLAGVWFKSAKGSGKMKGTAGVDDGFHAKFVIDRHKPNAFGYSGGNDFLSKGVKQAAPTFIKTMGKNLGNKVAAQMKRDLL